MLAHPWVKSETDLLDQGSYNAIATMDEEAPSWRGALEDAFARSIELQHTWPAIALVVWRINATLASVPVAVEARPKGLGHGAMHIGPPADEAGGLQLPLLACGARCALARVQAAASSLRRSSRRVRSRVLAVAPGIWSVSCRLSSRDAPRRLLSRNSSMSGQARNMDPICRMKRH